MKFISGDEDEERLHQDQADIVEKILSAPNYRERFAFIKMHKFVIFNAVTHSWKLIFVGWV